MQSKDHSRAWDKSAARRVRMRLNVPLITATLVAIVVFGGVGWWRYTSQSAALADALLVEGRRLQDGADWNKAARLLQDYLLLRPEDAEARTLLAEVYGHLAADDVHLARAIEQYRRAIGMNQPGSETETRLRQRLAELLLTANRFQEAEAEADTILARYSPEKSTVVSVTEAARGGAFDETAEAALRVKAIAACRQARPADRASASAAWSHLQRALDVRPGDFELAELAVGFMQSLPENAPFSEAAREAAIKEILDKLVEAAPDDVHARLVRYRHYAGRGEADGAATQAAADLEKALALAPGDYDVQMTAGYAALHRAEEARADENSERLNAWAEKARGHFETAREVNVRREDAHLALGQMAFVQGQAEEAIRLWQAGIDRRRGPGLELRLRIAEAALSVGDDARAETAIENATQAAAGVFAVQSSSAAKLRAVTLQNRIALLRAKLLLARRETASAVTLLRQLAVSAADGLEGTSDLISQRELSEVQYLLGLAYSRMRNWDLAADAFQKAIDAGLQSHHALLASALAWKKAGHIERAADHYARLLEQNDAPPAAMLELAEMRLQEQLQRPAGQREWTRFDSILEAIEKQVSDRWEVKLLAARRVLASGKQESADQAANLLADAERLAPNDAELWQKLVFLHESAGAPDRANAALTRFQELVPSKQRQLAVEIELLTKRGQHDQAAARLNQELPTADPPMEAVVLDRLWRVELQRGNWREARRHLFSLYERTPDDLRLIEHLANLDLQLGEYERVANWEERLRGLEGEDGTLWRYFRALRQVAQASGPSDPAFLDARRHAEAIRARRPAWGAGLALLGRIYAAEGDTDRGIQALEKAVQHGDRSLATYEQLVRQLYEAGRLEEAESYLAHLNTAVPSSGRLSQIYISLAADQQRWSEAEQRAEQAVRNRPSDPQTHIWFGHVLAAQDRLSDAEEAYRGAVAADERNPLGWQALAAFYDRCHRPRDAEQALEGLRQKADLPPIQKDFLIADHFSRHGHTQRAREVLREAENRDPSRPDIKRQLASLLLADDPELAEVKLREALKLAPDSDETRRMLAALLSARGGAQRWDESIELVRQPTENQPDDADLRMQAALLVRRGGKANRDQAIRTLEQLVRKPVPAPQDLLLLARLYEAEGRVAAARSQYDFLVLRGRPQPAHLMLAVDFHLRSGDAAEAGRLLEQLAGRAAELDGQEQQQWATLQTRYHLLADGEDAAVQFLEQWATTDAAGARTAGQQTTAAKILLDLGEHSAAEEWLRRLVQTDTTASPLLARALALQGRHREALRMCVDHAGEDVTTTIVSAIAVLLSCGSPSPDDFEFVRPVLEKAESRLREDPQALFALGLIAVLEERNEQAIAHFEALRRMKPSDVRTLNNLAALYGEQPDGLDRALEYIQAAIDTAGPQPLLLDTQGMLQLQQGDVEQAVASLEQAVAVPVPDPRYLFHLAAAYERAGKTDEASAVYRRATEAGLENELLTKGDKKLLAALDRQFTR